MNIIEFFQCTQCNHKKRKLSINIGFIESSVPKMPKMPKAILALGTAQTLVALRLRFNVPKIPKIFL